MGRARERALVRRFQHTWRHCEVGERSVRFGSAAGEGLMSVSASSCAIVCAKADSRAGRPVTARGFNGKIPKRRELMMARIGWLVTTTRYR